MLHDCRGTALPCPCSPAKHQGLASPCPYTPVAAVQYELAPYKMSANTWRAALSRDDQPLEVAVARRQGQLEALADPVQSKAMRHQPLGR